MKNFELIYYLLIIVFILDRTVFRKKRCRKGSTKKQRRATTSSASYASSYIRVPLLTQREQRQYAFLKQIADEKNVLICPKVRLLDLVSPVHGVRNYKALLSKVMSKHVDFVICDQEMYVLGIIELDDSTHFRQDRIQRDEFVDIVLKGAGYKIKHTFEITSDILDDFLNLHNVTNPDRKIISPTGWIWNEETKLWDPPQNVK